MSEFLTIGEPIALFGSEEVDKSLKDACHFQKFLAGAEVNVAVGVSRLGHSSEYITQVGKDPFGEFIIDRLHENKILDKIDFSEVKMAHLSGIFPAISAEAQEAFRYLIHLLEKNNIRTTFDPNLRPQLWASQEEMVETINDLASHAEIVLPGINEGEILMGSRDPEAIADFYLNNGEATKTVIVKLGTEGAYVKQKDGTSFTVPGFKVAEVVDTVGAGDGFAVGLITGLIEGKSLKQAVIRANAIGAMAVQSPGDNDGYPTPQELEEFLQQQEVEA